MKNKMATKKRGIKNIMRKKITSTIGADGAIPTITSPSFPLPPTSGFLSPNGFVKIVIFKMNQFTLVILSQFNSLIKILTAENNICATLEIF